MSRIFSSSSATFKRASSLLNSSSSSSSSSGCSFLSKFWPNSSSIVSSYTTPPLLLQQPCCFMGTKSTIKTHKGAAKRFRVRGSGSIKRNKGGYSHNTGYKTRQRCNRLGQTDGIKEASIEKRIRSLISGG